MSIFWAICTGFVDFGMTPTKQNQIHSFLSWRWNIQIVIYYRKFIFSHEFNKWYHRKSLFTLSARGSKSTKRSNKSKNNQRQKWQTSKQIFTFASYFSLCEWALRYVLMACCTAQRSKIWAGLFAYLSAISQTVGSFIICNRNCWWWPKLRIGMTANCIHTVLKFVQVSSQ